LKCNGAFLFEGSAWFDGQSPLIGLSPFAFFESKQGISVFTFQNASQKWERKTESPNDPLACLQRLLDQFRLPKTASDPPFSHGGAVGYLGYDLIQQYEPVLAPTAPAPSGLPEICMNFINCFLRTNLRDQTTQIVYNPAPLVALGWPPDLAVRTGHRFIAEIEKKLLDTTVVSAPECPLGPMQKTHSKEDYIQMVKRALDYIAAGDIFQANLSHRFHATVQGESIFALYQRLYTINPSPFSAYLKMGGVEVACGSPERLVCVRKNAGANQISTRPIAGTAPRGKTAEEDRQAIAALYKSAKERAEHLMLVDLERNDIGKVACFGSVTVDALMTLETYSHVFHLVSNIVGTVRPEISASDALKALFPGGTITGVPKVRCMQIISELEQSSRGLYTGSVGYIDFSGEIDFNIIIRSWVRQGNWLSFQVGAGIVADSDPEREYQETLDKAAALLKAVS
jgi:anthranilate/para-aminobenzoate synthase component I